MHYVFPLTRVKDRIHDAKLRAMAELHRVSTFAIVACNIARSMTGLGARSTSATFHTTIALYVCLLQANIACDVTKTF